MWKYSKESAIEQQNKPWKSKKKDIQGIFGKKIDLKKGKLPIC